MTDISCAPEEIIEQILLDVSIMVENKYGQLLSKTALFNLNKLNRCSGRSLK